MPHLQLAVYPAELLMRYDVRETLGTGAFSEVKVRRHASRRLRHTDARTGGH